MNFYQRKVRLNGTFMTIKEKKATVSKKQGKINENDFNWWHERPLKNKYFPMSTVRGDIVIHIYIYTHILLSIHWKQHNTKKRWTKISTWSVANRRSMLNKLEKKITKRKPSTYVHIHPWYKLKNFLRGTWSRLELLKRNQG